MVTLNDRSLFFKQGLESAKDFNFIHSKATVLQLKAMDEFVDIHEWVFTPGSFRVLINDLRELGFINLEEVSFYCDNKNTCEFCISLKKTAADSLKKEFDQKRRMTLYQFKLQDEIDFYNSIRGSNRD